LIVVPHSFRGLALHTWTVDTTPLDDALAAAKAGGFDAVELRRAQVRGRARQTRQSGGLLARLLAFGLQGAQRRQHIAILLLARHVAVDPRRQFLFALLLDRQAAALHQSFEHALLIGHAVVQALYSSCDLQRDRLILFHQLVDNRELFPRQADRTRHAPLRGFFHLRVSLVPLRSPGIAGDKYQIARLSAGGGHLEPARRLDHDAGQFGQRYAENHRRAREGLVFDLPFDGGFESE